MRGKLQARSRLSLDSILSLRQGSILHTCVKVFLAQPLILDTCQYQVVGTGEQRRRCRWLEESGFLP